MPTGCGSARSRPTRACEQIICGAPNARAGIDVVVAKPGTYVPGIDTTIQVGKIRGVESHGMMCSEREMELSDEHDGIIELPGEPAVGHGIRRLAGGSNDPAAADPVIEIEDHPEPPRCAGHPRHRPRPGGARAGHAEAARPRCRCRAGFPSRSGWRSTPELAGKGCPLFAGRLIRGVRNGPSPALVAGRG